MKRLALIMILVAIPAVASAQMNMSFVTTAQPAVVKPGAVLTITATFTHADWMPMDVSKDALFLVGLTYSLPGPFGMFVSPPIPVGTAKFTETKVGNMHIHKATLQFPVPKVTLPPNFMANFYFQGVAAVKTPMWRQPVPMPAFPAPVTLVSP